MKLTKILGCLAMAVAGSQSALAAGPAFDIIPLWGIKVKYDGLKYADIRLKTADATPIVNNNIPQNLKFMLWVDRVEGFTDSAGVGTYGLELSMANAEGRTFSTVKDYFGGKGVLPANDKAGILVNLGFDAQTKPNTRIKITARLFDRKGKGFVLMNFDVTVVPASKKLQNTIQSYTTKDSKGMRSSSVGLHFNFFEFKGLSGNNFLYRIRKTDALEFSLKGLEGWKAAEGKVNPLGEIVIFDADGNELEANDKVLDNTVGESMPKDKKELQVKYKPTSVLESGKAYYIWFKLADKNSKKAALDVVVKVYVD